MKPYHIKRIKIALRICVPLIVISFFFYYIDRLISLNELSQNVKFALSGIVYFYFIATALAMFIFSCQEIFYICRNFKMIGFRAFYPLCICIASIGFCGPKGPTSEFFESRKIYSAYREGTVSHLILKLRQNSRFEINNRGLGMSEYSYGDWRKEGDTIYLKRDANSPEVKGLTSDTLIVTNDRLNPIDNVKDSSGMYLYRQFILTTKPN